MTRWSAVLFLVWILVLAGEAHPCGANETAAGMALAVPPSTGPAHQPPQKTREIRRVVFVTLAVPVHALPLMRIANEVVSKCCRFPEKPRCIVDFASHSTAAPWFVEEMRFNKNSPCLGDFIDLGPISETWMDRLRAISSDPSFIRSMLTGFNDLFLGMMHSMFEAVGPIVTKPQLPSLAVVDTSALGALERVRISGIPVILYSPTIFAGMFAHFEQYHWLPQFGTGLSVKGMSLAERCFNTLLPRVIAAALQPALMSVNQMRLGLGLPPYRTGHDVFKDMRTICTVALGFDYAKPVVPQMHAFVGPVFPQKKGRRFSTTKRLRNFVNALQKSRKPLFVIRYSELLPLEGSPFFELKQALEWLATKHAFGVVWYIESGPTMSIKGVDVLWKKPFHSSTQFDLYHRNGDDFQVISVSTCTMASVQEPLAFAVPVLCVPLVADQSDVAARVRDSGAGLTLTRAEWTAGNLLVALHSLLHKPIFRERSRVTSKIIQLGGGRKRAASLIVTSLRLRENATSVYINHRSQTWHKRLGIDVAAFYISVVAIIGAAYFLHWRYLQKRRFGF